MNYRILSKAILKTIAWMIGGGVGLGVGMLGLSVLPDVTKPFQALIVLVIILLICIGFSISDTYKKMIKKEDKKREE